MKNFINVLAYIIFMYKQLILSFVFIFSLFGVFAADVEVEAKIINSEVYFKYIFNFNEEDILSSFSFEKPLGSKFILAQDENGEKLTYSIAGDYYIFKPNEVKNKTFIVEFSTQTLYFSILNSRIYENYVNFNFLVENLVYSLDLGEIKNEMMEVFPRDYQISSNKIIWKFQNIQQDTLFLIKFSEKEKSDSFFENYFNYIIIVLIILILILIFFMFIYIKKIRKKQNISEKNQENLETKENINLNKNSQDLILEKNDEFNNNTDLKKEKNLNVINSETISLEKNTKEDFKNVLLIQENKFDELVKKYLTENEREVVNIVLKYEGIAQYDILNHLPNLSKSNLSKILTKLNSKKILTRIRVGKINKIYLGEKLETEKNITEKEKN